jgi:hypothetical protein
MSWLWVAFSLYISYYTFSYALQVWREDSKLAGISVAFLSLCFLPIAIWIYLR